MPKFPSDARREQIVKALQALGFELVREGSHIAFVRQNADGTRTPLTMPNHRTIKGSTLRTILRQSQIGRDEFLDAYKKAK
jgi:predicted RNA binding protein YcfA (HicA-like mRNA interferase family)